MCTYLPRYYVQYIGTDAKDIHAALLRSDLFFFNPRKMDSISIPYAGSCVCRIVDSVDVSVKEGVGLLYLS